MWWLVVAIPAVAFTVLGVLLWLGARERRRTNAELAAITSLPVAVAQERALALLERPDIFQTTRASTPFTRSDLPSHVVALFVLFDHVGCGEFWLGREALSQSARLPGFIKIGEDCEFTEILVRPGDPLIYVSYGDGPQTERTLETVPSVWHELLIAPGVPAESA